MTQVILRRTSNATVSVEVAVALVSAGRKGRVLHHSGDNLLADIDPAQLSPLKEQLAGWIVSPQAATIPVPDTRLKVR